MIYAILLSFSTLNDSHNAIEQIWGTEQLRVVHTKVILYLKISN